MLTLDKIYHAAFVLKDVARKTDLIEGPQAVQGLPALPEDREPAGHRQLQGARRLL